MSDPPPTGYISFDSDAPRRFSITGTDNAFKAAFIALLLYDHVITLDKEVEWIWTLRWQLPKILFIVHRYIVTLMFLLTNIPEFIFPLPISLCNVIFRLVIYLPLLNFGTAELLIIVRVCALYDHDKLVKRSLGGLYALALIVATASEMLYGRMLRAVLSYKFLPGCSAQGSSSSHRWITWFIFALVEGILMFLTAYKLLSYRNQPNRTIVVLARDSIVYFVLVFASLTFLVASEFDRDIKPDAQIVAQCVTSIAVGRMMMNIRGLILDYPEHSIYLRSATIIPRADSEHEMVVYATQSKT